MERGFTLIELLIVVAIIGVLAAIAIPQFNSYKSRANNAKALADLRNANTAQEAFYLDWESYQVCNDAGCNDPGLPGFNLSDGVSLQMQPNGAGDAYAAISQHSDGSIRYGFSSANGQFSETDV